MATSTDLIRPFALPNDTQRRVIVGDIHNDVEAFYQLMNTVEAIDSNGHRNPDVWVGTVGDIIHGGHDQWGNDGPALREVLSVVDALLIGNHDAPFAFGVTRFAGQHDHLDPEATSLLNRTVRRDLWKIAIAVDGWLVSHAGVHPEFFKTIPRHLAQNPTLLAAWLNDQWINRIMNRSVPVPLFDDVGHARGGSKRYGGVLWCDWNELQDGYEFDPNLPLRQIVGHTPQVYDGPLYSRDKRLINIDVGAKLSGRLAAAVKEPSDKTWTLVSVDVRP